MDIGLKRQLWIGSVIILVSIAFAVAALFFISSDIDGVVRKIVVDRAEIDQQTGSLAILANLTKQAPEAGVYKAAMDKFFPSQDDLINFDPWIARIAAAHQVTATVSFQGASPTAPAGNGIGQITFSLVLDGAMNDISAFLSAAESKEPGFFMRISGFSIANMGGGTYQLKGQGILFFRA